MALKDDLQKIIKGEVIDDPETILKYNHDSSIFEITPQVIVKPINSQDIKSLVCYIVENPKENLSITVRSGGTDMTGGAINDSIILDIGNLNRLLEIKEDTATTQPGMFYRDFEKETLKQNLLLPTYPASREICTVGGMFVNNAGGELELTYGPIDKYVLESKTIFADGNEYVLKPLNESELKEKIAEKTYEGNIYKQIFDLINDNKELIQKAKPITSKNSTGYEIWNVLTDKTFDLNKLFIGAQGTLGITTQIKFRLIEPKKEQVLLVIALQDLKELDQVVKKVLEYNPEAFECYDDQTLKLSVDHAWDMSANFKHNNRLSAFLNLKGETKPLPNLILLANFTSDDKSEATQRAEMAKKSIESLNLKAEILDSPASQEKYWLIRHKSFGLLMKYAKGMKASPFIDDIIVKPEFLPEFLPKLNSIIEPYKGSMVYTLAGHIGDGNFHIIPLMDLSKEEVRVIIPELMEKVFKLVFEYHGSMSAEHNDGLIRGAYLPEMYGEDIYQLFKKIKQIFDPKNIFNPHKKVDATFKYSWDHMVKNN